MLASPQGGMVRNGKRILLLGLGNDILSDDAVGLLITQAVRQRLAGFPQIEVHEIQEMGLSLLDYIADVDQLVLIDAVQTGHAPPGFLHEFDGAQLGALPMRWPHSLGIGEILALGKQLGLAVPEYVLVFGVEVLDPLTVSTDMTPALRDALPGLVQQVIQRLEGMLG